MQVCKRGMQVNVPGMLKHPLGVFASRSMRCLPRASICFLRYSLQQLNRTLLSVQFHYLSPSAPGA